MSDTFELTPAESRRISQGVPRPLVRDEDPKLDQGAIIVVKVFEARAIGDEDTGRLTIPEERALWITITSVVRTTKGHWSVRYSITDRRDIDTPGHFLARGHGRTTDPRRSIDPDAPILDDEIPAAVLERFAADAQRRREAERTARRQAEALLPIERRVAVMRAEAQRRCIDIRNEVRLIAKLKEQGKPLENPVQGIRRKLDRDLGEAA